MAFFVLLKHAKLAASLDLHIAFSPPFCMGWRIGRSVDGTSLEIPFLTTLSKEAHS